MPKEIWNEGRVVGYSAYELYAKQHLAEDPDSEPASEREWLASSISIGASMLLKVPVVNQPDDAYTYVDIPLPENTRLGAANTILGSFFDGDGAWNGNWATKITDYGYAISNSTKAAPPTKTTPATDEPSQFGQSQFMPRGVELSKWPDSKKEQLRDYMKIVDGLIIHPGDWSTNPDLPPQKDFSPNLSEYPKVRLLIKGSVTTEPRLLLSGFTIRYILCGTLGHDSAANTYSPQDGDFLGPAVFPWAAKIVFSVPNQYIAHFTASSFKRRLSSGDTASDPTSYPERAIHEPPIIDMGQDRNGSPVLENYYVKSLSTDNGFYARSEHRSDSPRIKVHSRVPEAITDFAENGHGSAIITVYQKQEVYPPALYGAYVSGKGNHHIHPIDVVAPGSLKCFIGNYTPGSSGGNLQHYEITFPGTTAVGKDNTHSTLWTLHSDDKVVPVANLENTPFYAESLYGYEEFYNPNFPEGGWRSKKIQLGQIQAGSKNMYVLQAADEYSDNPDYITGSPYYASTRWSPVLPDGVSQSKIPLSDPDYLTWYDLSRALAGGYKIDILGDKLRAFKHQLETSSINLSVTKMTISPSSGHLGKVAPSFVQRNKLKSIQEGKLFSDADGGDSFGVDSPSTAPSGEAFFDRIKLDVLGYPQYYNDGRTSLGSVSTRTYNSMATLSLFPTSRSRAAESMVYKAPVYNGLQTRNFTIWDSDTDSGGYGGIRSPDWQNSFNTYYGVEHPKSGKLESGCWEQVINISDSYNKYYLLSLLQKVIPCSYTYASRHIMLWKTGSGYTPIHGGPDGDRNYEIRMEGSATGGQLVVKYRGKEVYSGEVAAEGNFEDLIEVSGRGLVIRIFRTRKQAQYTLLQIGASEVSIKIPTDESGNPQDRPSVQEYKTLVFSGAASANLTDPTLSTGYNVMMAIDVDGLLSDPALLSFLRCDLDKNYYTPSDAFMSAGPSIKGIIIGQSNGDAPIWDHLEDMTISGSIYLTTEEVPYAELKNNVPITIQWARTGYNDEGKPVPEGRSEIFLII